MINNEFESSFEKGMLKEHLILARSLGIRFLVIVGNKMDLINWDQDKYNANIQQIKKFLKYIHWNENSIYDIPIAAYDGIGLTDTQDMPDWYKGKSFLEIIKGLPDKKNF